MAQEPIICNACHREIPPDASGRGRARAPAFCPHCGAMVVIDDTQEVPAEAPPAQEQELEERKIRQIVRSRRAAVRMRGWYIVALLAAVVLAAQQLTWFVAALVRERGAWDGRQTARLALAAVLLAVAVLLRERVKHLSAELRRHALPEPTTPPDFRPLSDGSQRVRNLEDLDREQ